MNCWQDRKTDRQAAQTGMVMERVKRARLFPVKGRLHVDVREGTWQIVDDFRQNKGNAKSLFGRIRLTQEIYNAHSFDECDRDDAFDYLRNLFSPEFFGFLKRIAFTQPTGIGSILDEGVCEDMVILPCFAAGVTTPSKLIRRLARCPRAPSLIH